MPRAVVESVRTISADPRYHGWPTIAATRDGELLAVCSGGRVAHVCPFGQVQLYRSVDRGESWLGPFVLADGPLDDRDAGVIQTHSGALLVNWFTSTAYFSAAEREGGLDGFSPTVQAHWRRRHDAATDDVRLRELGHWIVRSTDGGITWSDPIPSAANSPHGPIMLNDGRLFYAGRRSRRGDPENEGAAFAPEIGAAVSEDDGLTWRWLSTITPAPGDNPANYHELHAAQTPSGRIVVQIRDHNKANQNETTQCESEDGGLTWSMPHSIGVWGHPSHLLTLPDGRLLMTYGYRRAPIGNYVRVSDDEGRTWSDAMALDDKAIGGDMGYPSTCMTADGTLFSLWYEVMAGDPNAVLRMATWRLDG